MSDRRYPVEPLCALMRLAPSTALVRLGVSGSTMQKYRDEGVSARVADRLAVRAGYHPAEVWPEWVDEQIEATKVECAAEDCAERFLPSNAKHRYCSGRCRARISSRRRTQVPEVRQRRAERRRRYYAEVGDYERRRESARYWSDPERWRAARRDRYRRKKNENAA